MAGQGVAGIVGGREVRLGRAGWAGAAEADSWVRAARRRSRLDGALTVFVAVDGRAAGVLLLEDRIRPDARQTLRAVRRGGISRIVLATGDRAEAAGAVGALAGADEVLAELTPAGKLEVVRREQRRAPVIMTGDGINDAPALALADVGIAMGARGATASSEAADAVLTVDELGPARRGGGAGPAHPADRPAERAGRHGHVAGRHGRRGRGAASRGVGRAAAGGHRRRGDTQRAPRAGPGPAAGAADRSRRGSDPAVPRRAPGDPLRHRAAADGRARPRRARRDGPGPARARAAHPRGMAARARRRVRACTRRWTGYSAAPTRPHR